MADKGPMEGEKAPDFTLPEASEKDVSLSEEVKKGTVVLAFYPTDFGITCTLEFKKFREMAEDLRKAKASLLGISVNSTRSHRSWKENIRVDFPLLSDSDANVSKAYDVMSPEDSLLRGHSTRAIFVVDDKQVIRYRWVALDSHIQPDYELLSSKVKELNSSDK